MLPEYEDTDDEYRSLQVRGRLERSPKIGNVKILHRTKTTQ